MSNIISKIKSLCIPCRENSFTAKLLNGKVMFWYAIFALGLQFLAIFGITFISQNLPADVTKTAIVKLTNQERANIGLPQLEASPELDQAAKLKAQDMFKNGYFNHYSPLGTSPWFWFGVAGYKYEYAGENLAIGFVESEEVYSGWQNSFSHHQNLLNPNYTQIGVAVVEGNFNGATTKIVVQLFGNPKEEKSAPTTTKPVTLKTNTTPKPTPKPVAPIAGAPAGNTQVKVAQTKNQVTSNPQVAGQTKGQDINPQAIDKEILPAPTSQSWQDKIMTFLVIDLNNWVKRLLLVSIIIFGLVFLVNLAFYFHCQRPEAALKILFFLTILTSLYFLDKQAVVQLIPHDFMIL